MPTTLAIQNYPDDFLIVNYRGSLALDTILFYADRDYVVDQISLTMTAMSSATGTNGRLSFQVSPNADSFSPTALICTADCRTVANSGTGAAGTTFVFDSERAPAGVTKQYNATGLTSMTSSASLSATGATTASPFSSANNVLRRGQYLVMSHTTNTGATGVIQIRLRSRIS